MQIKFLAFYACILFSSTSAMALKYHGSLTIGSYTAKETITPETTDFDQSTSNNYFTTSGRLRLNFTHIGGKKNKSVHLDVRDKFDFFGALDRENQKLTSENSLFLRQLYYQQSNKLIKKVGRFSVFNAGSTFVDGIELGWKKNKKLNFGAFLGLNPRSLDKIELSFNSDAQVAGLFFDYKKESRATANYLYYTGSIVGEVNFGELDRGYYYQNVIYQLSRNKRIYSHLYLDFVPRTYIQNGLISYNQQINKKLSGNLSLSAIDVIEYRRNQSIRETLESSPYKELRASAKYRTKKNVYLTGLIRSGKRDADSLTYSEYSLGVRLPRFFSKKIDFIVKAGQRKQFTQTGPFARLGAAYFSKKWEFGFDVDYANEKNDDGTKLSPIVIEGSVARQFSKKLFASAVAQYGKDDKTTIQSYFLKLGYRFGKKEIAPLRGGAAPRGSL